ncbi:hypothetical protein MFLO_12076 [Listeria floridensis FSL S10-1187]|uniref:DUF3324 domain-containing protein n=1 Tax=Listeria floridensis FSL S10-1187 TaxID=1265817 RepID=A0ABP3AYA8_9LIST|nr:DUF916 and DUF3324 domain-containing protein [Listeria floridensis]EUJ28483.1 hypothetical protein MFLO_12076 [Listeria floridensis FSL S10-1187]
MKLKTMIVGLTASAALILGMPLNGEASDMKYSVKANIPENQVDKTKTYFDLRVKPGAVQTISLTLQNNAAEEAVIEVEPNRATTNRNGVINYGKSIDKKDKTLKADFEEMVSKKQEVVLKPNEEKQVKFTLTMPKEAFKGTVLGGFYVHKKESDKEAKQEKDVQIKNDYSYIIGVKLTESDEKVEPNLQLGQVKPGLQNYHTIVSANLENTAATIISGMTVESKVYKKGKTKVLHEAKVENQMMAPNSNYDLPISWNDQVLEPGKYTLELKAQDMDGHKWKFTKDFEIRNHDKKYNDEAVGLEEGNDLVQNSVVAALFTVLIALLIFAFERYRRKRQ